MPKKKKKKPKYGIPYMTLYDRACLLTQLISLNLIYLNYLN